MTSFIVRTVTYSDVSTDLESSQTIQSQWFVELLILGCPKFKERVRGRKFFPKTGENPFDNCIAYLGRLSTGNWLSHEEYDRAMLIAFRSWRLHDEKTVG